MGEVLDCLSMQYEARTDLDKANSPNNLFVRQMRRQKILHDVAI